MSESQQFFDHLSHWRSD